MFAGQGIKIPIRKDGFSEGKSGGKGKGNAGGDDYDDE
jgi:hypothetical protein